MRTGKSDSPFRREATINQRAFHSSKKQEQGLRLLPPPVFLRVYERAFQVNKFELSSIIRGESSALGRRAGKGYE
jgi:hypothetical protein